MNRLKRRYLFEVREKRRRRLYQNLCKSWFRDEADNPRQVEQWLNILCHWNPPSSYRKKWRQEARTRNNRALRLCEDFDALQIFPTQKVTSIYDWF